MFATLDLYSGMMRGLYPGQAANPARNYPHPGMAGYHQHNLHRYQQVGKTRSNSQFTLHLPSPRIMKWMDVRLNIKKSCVIPYVKTTFYNEYPAKLK